MASFFISLLGGAYCLVEEESAEAVAQRISAVAASTNAQFIEFARPDGKLVWLAPRDVTLIQPPAPASFKPTDTKEN